MKEKTVLVIADGIGHNESDYFNAFAHAKKPAYDWLFANAPHTLIKTYGEFIGLPKGQMGNSEVGHLTIGSGRVLYQSLERINSELKNIKANLKMQKFLADSKSVHILGLISDGGVHSHINHFIELSKLARDEGKEVFLHLITDGRDTSPTSGLEFVKEIEKIQGVQIASLSGRFYAMDRDKRWERTKMAYDVITGACSSVNLGSASDYVKKSYEEGITDEFITPVCFIKNIILESDGLLCVNFRADRMRQIVSALGERGFLHFERGCIFNNVLIMSPYDDKFDFSILFPKEEIANTLSEVISRANMSQVHIAETEKYAHVTFFFNGGREEPFVGEERVLIPSPKVKTYDLKPEMSAHEVGDAVLQAMHKGSDFIVVNFANGDMVGHTGDFDACVKAVEAVDFELERIISKAKELDYALIITADHGNCEKMRDEDGEILTNHTVGDVHCFVVSKREICLKSDGDLSNLAASVLKLMGLAKPDEMKDALF